MRNGLCQGGSYSPAPPPTDIISKWAFTDELHLLVVGRRVAVNKPQVDANIIVAGLRDGPSIIRNFQFVPLGQPRPASLARPQWQNGEFLFDISSEPDWRYQVQRSTELHSCAKPQHAAGNEQRRDVHSHQQSGDWPMLLSSDHMPLKQGFRMRLPLSRTLA